MFYIDIFLFILVIFSFLIFIIKDTNIISDSFYLKEYYDFIELLNECDLNENYFCYNKLSDIYNYIVYINDTKVYDNLCLKPKLKIERIYYNKKVVILGC